MLIAYYDMKTKEVRFVCTDITPAIGIFSRIEEDMVIQARERADKTGNKLRAQFYVNVNDCPLMANPIKRAQVERKLKEFLANHQYTSVYVMSQGVAPAGGQAEHSKTEDISADFARKP